MSKKLQIHDDITVAALQAQFNAVFPFLKLEILYTSPKADTHAGLTLKQCRRLHNEGNFELRPQETLMDFVSRINEEFGLRVEVYRKCGKMWIATTLSNAWTLERQNNEGLEINNYKNG